ncbi:MAG: bifunctional precorrin-2 dehydrogenase/sirohydrochlorin ferrochelatase [Planctomycetes bacterium]|nr:bifunctional precorrin-2 dehydrogenase/sirohydrochlorin ferrochelatase [Planctomycetota bacterium]
MPDLPVMLRISGRRCVVIGGGRVARRRAAALLDAGGDVTVIAPTIDPDLVSLKVKLEQRPYRNGDLAGAVLVVVATDDPAVNRLAADEARRVGVLVNRADDPESGDISIPAHAHHGPITLAVHTSGGSATASALIRRQMSDALDPDWPRLIELVSPYRSKVQAGFKDTAQRTARLARLADADALAVLKRDGTQALLARCEDLLKSPISQNLDDPA